MKQDPLERLGLTPSRCGEITSRARTRLINWLVRWEHYEAALACLEVMLALDPGRLGLLDARVEALLGLGRAEEALATLDERHAIGRSLASQALEARVHLARGDVAAADAVARQLTETRPDAVVCWQTLGEVRLAQGDLAGALAAAQRIAALRPYSRAYLLSMLAFYQAQGEYVTASGYAVQLERTAGEGQSLPAYALQRLRAYYQASGETTRGEAIDRQLAALYERELRRVEEALHPDVRAAAPTGTRPVLEEPVPLPLPAEVPVSQAERRRIEEAAGRFFGFAGLLPGQAETMAAALRGQDVLTVLPTGGGKSLCYQVPALLDTAGTTLVISPLIALMKDQVDSLPAPVRGHATTLNSSLGGDELARRMDDVAAGRYRLVYAAPERLRQPPFLHALRRCGVNRLVIDEAHCISVWGHDFRPDYLAISRARQALGNPPVLAMTATAPPRVRRDILQRLGGGAGGTAGMAVVATPVYRPNLILAAARAQNNDEKLRILLAFCQSAEGPSIIYAGTRARCEQIAALLRDRGIAAAHYHAGLADRAAVQDAFMSGKVRVIVATIAFGMGVDKADIRSIVHLQLPDSLEAYTQEVGRAGRDGQPAHCLLIYSPADRGTLTRRARQAALSTEFLRRVYAAVRRRLDGASPGRVAADDLLRDLQVDETALRVALSTLEEARLLRRHADVAHAAVVCMTGDAPDDPAARAFVSAARLRPGQRLGLNLIDVARRAKLDPVTVEESVLAWAAAGWLDYRPSGRDMVLELLPARGEATGQVEALLDRYAAIQAQRIDEIATYAATTGCRHSHISAYLSGQPLPGCRSCDNCRPKASPVALAGVPDLPGEVEQLATVLRCAATAPWSWGRVSLRRILRGEPGAPERGRQSSEWRALAFRSQAAVDALLDRLVEVDLLRPRQLDNGGVVLDLTPAGRAALADRSALERAAAPPAAPRPRRGRPAGEDVSLGASDLALFERLRAWARETAQAARVPTYVVAELALLRRIAAARPQTEDELRAIRGMGPKRLARYGAAILALVRAANPGDPQS
jgi:ATP-dependent DNA helicase RecQ